MNTKANHSIKCSVNECEHHCNAENYCSLNCVTIGTHEANPTLCKCVDCESFQLKNKTNQGSVK
ncbi:MAG: DUF1540 domain-containing protein [Acutalibacteraceae bacterium]|nr:DUF1540 domain-containing protein [Clostridia bacterium]MEE3449672.1 DUF1540 domain-containing protein [Acutalibacteraceae bacterium]